MLYTHIIKFDNNILFMAHSSKPAIITTKLILLNFRLLL
jgi:hypothetical protein